MMRVRGLTLAVLLIVAAALAADFVSSVPNPAKAPAAASTAADDDAPSVAKVCGFAPCGLPLDCD